MRHDPRPDPEPADLLKGLAAGVAGGLVGTAAMTLCQSALSRAFRLKEERESQEGPAMAAGEPAPSWEEQQELQQGSYREPPATQQAAAAVSERVRGEPLGEAGNQIAPAVLHYAFGAGAAGAYGVAVEAAPKLAAGAGLPFGAAVMILANELGFPALGLGRPPTQRPWPMHATAFTSHLVYGLVSEQVRRAVRRRM